VINKTNQEACINLFNGGIMVLQHAQEAGGAGNLINHIKRNESGVYMVKAH
jgi:hypothetical protein